MTEEGKPPQPPRKKLADHPWVLAALGALLGVLATIVGTGISDWYSQQQYWREQRTVAYVAYGTTLVEADNAVTALQLSISESVGKTMDAKKLEEMRTRLSTVRTKLDTTVAPVQALGHEDLAQATSRTYLTQSLRVDRSIRLVDGSLRARAVTLEHAQEHFAYVQSAYQDTAHNYPTVSQAGYPVDFIDASRSVLRIGK